MCGFSRLLASIRVRLPGRHPRRSSQSQSLLLQLPIELLVEISGWLSSGSAVAFALTCTSLFGNVFPKDKLRGIQLEELLQLLERDLSKQLFFCQPCLTLHRFSPSWSPEHQDHFDGPCKPKVMVRDTFHLGFHFAHLAMNKHLLGGGLALEQLTCSSPTHYRGWDINFMARVIEDELYLSVSHRLSLNGTGRHNREELELSHHGICNHVTTHRPKALPQRTRIPELAPSDSPGYFNTLTECRDARGSCPVCLTDYSITTIRKKSNDVTGETAKESWDIVIIAYHQLGPCRSQSDWKWLTYATKLPDVCEQNLDASLLGKRCKNWSYAPGSVKARWDRG
ncbi:hypothetical protein F5883DRAFT_417832 [Diaporthe sp. PMI_573]|nr:hypothetical protein F5883DRAFT_417832 [Diaporthaceae sp. PMI_573]